MSSRRELNINNAKQHKLIKKRNTRNAIVHHSHAIFPGDSFCFVRNLNNDNPNHTHTSFPKTTECKPGVYNTESAKTLHFLHFLHKKNYNCLHRAPRFCVYHFF